MRLRTSNSSVEREAAPAVESCADGGVKKPKLCMLILALAWLGGCASGGALEETDAAPDSTFAAVYTVVLAPSCAFSSCHGPASAGYLGWSDPASAYAALVDRASAAAAERVLVVPGEPESSYLLDKLLGADGINGDPMPPPVGGLDADKVELVRSWIAAGAPND